MHARKIIFSLTAAAALSGFAFSGDLKAGGVDDAKNLQEAFNSVAEKSFPSVVVITVKKRLGQESQPFLEQFFDNYPQLRKFRPRGGQQQGQPQDTPPEMQGKGSGFIVNEDGFILTNNHVVAESDEISVKLKDGSEYKAEIKGTDPKTDLALLKIKADKKLPSLKFADSDKVKVGDWAIAVGAPFNFDYSMTVGVVSQKGRAVGINVYENYIQTDASINRGNSGGPLLDIEGEVIGVNDFIVTGGSYSDGNIGLGFAIPSNMAKEVMEQLMKTGSVVRPWVGIALETLTPETKAQFSVGSGVLVREVFANEPADKAGIEPGDIILSIDGKEVASSRDVQMEVLKKRPGDNVVFSILRGGKKTDITVVPQQQDSEQLGMKKGGTARPADGFGIEFREKDGEIEIARVEPGSPAANAGLQPGTKVMQINMQKVKTLADVEGALKKQDEVLMLNITDGKSKMIVTLKKKP